MSQAVMAMAGRSSGGFSASQNSDFGCTTTTLTFSQTAYHNETLPTQCFIEQLDPRSSIELLIKLQLARIDLQRHALRWIQYYI